MQKAKAVPLSISQLKQLNKTTTRLYRILLRECRPICLHDELATTKTETRSVESKDHSYRHLILLQQPLDPRDWGRAKLFPASSIRTAHSPTSQTILDFLESCRPKLTGFDALSSSSPTKSSKTTQDNSTLVSRLDIFNAIKNSFHESIPDISAETVLDRHRRAIDAIRTLQLQVSINQRTCVTFDKKRGIRVIATSRCIGRALKSPMAAMEGDISNRFAYRIRVENTGVGDEGGGRPVQLLGRYWNIEEEGEDASDPVIVKAPTTGAVGHLPVIHPGEIFEYMSGCEISTRTGTLSGLFYMAEVGEDTNSAMVGDAVDALDGDDEKKFEMPIGPFHLVSEGGEYGDGE